MLLRLSIALSTIITAIFLSLFYLHYFRKRDCFNAQGRCFDHEHGVIYHEQSGLFWLSGAILVAIITLVLIKRLRRKKFH
ncbi:hypothetical protein GCM10007939_10010 [Amylibacter marinus]|uniref:LPXTG cell wall anchor domain-containing protein n=1 Tax=Amylibacter marinus TaxID=1475483 RepID=A0ABQ5VTG0_9RHOB|nr:hypothetical protein [Amylibacter marinus]GLQ34718.1 hypothetical protein GCM10007939_10010 [Amylibacter marinus]